MSDKSGSSASSVRRICLVALLTMGAACAQVNAPTDGPRKLSRVDELLKASGGPSAAQIGGNPHKWAGHYVTLTCEIINVTSDSDEIDDQSQGAEWYVANAKCGKGVNGVRLVTPQPDLDYSDPSAVHRAISQAQRQGQEYRREAEDVASIVLIGDKVKTLDGNQRVTIVGPVLRPDDSDDARVRIDYAQ
jgi:hypothetical protein